VTLELSASGRKDVLHITTRKKDVQRNDRERRAIRRTLYLDDSRCDLNKGCSGFPEWVQDHDKRGAEGPDHSNNHPRYNKKGNSV
jgi:hypothetical protein